MGGGQQNKIMLETPNCVPVLLVLGEGHLFKNIRGKSVIGSARMPGYANEVVVT